MVVHAVKESRKKYRDTRGGERVFQLLNVLLKKKIFGEGIIETNNILEGTEKKICMCFVFLRWRAE